VQEWLQQVLEGTLGEQEKEQTVEEKGIEKIDVGKTNVQTVEG
jgi:hypothetical protein